MDRLSKMQQWAAGQSTSQYGNNPWVQAMMKFMRGLKGNYGSSASGWGGGTSNAGQQAQAPAPKPPAQQQQQQQGQQQQGQQQQGQPPGNSDGRQIGSPQSDNSIRPRPGIVRDPSAPGEDSRYHTMPAYNYGYVGKGKGTTDHLGHPQINGDYGWIPTESGKLPNKDVDHLGMPYKGGNSSGYHSMPVGHDSGYHIMPAGNDSGYHIMPVLPSYGNAQSAPILDYSPGITNFGPENVMRVTSMPGVLGNVYPQWVTDYMMSHRSNSSGQGQGV